LYNAFFSLLKRDLRLAFRHKSEILNPLFFFVIVVTLFPLGISPDRPILTEIGPGIIWVAALLSSMLSLDGMFRSDFEDGTLEQMLLSEYPLSILVLAKIVAHWLITGFPILIFSPLMGTVMFLSNEAIGTLMLTLLLGTPILSLIGAIGMALVVGLKRGGMLLSLLVLPLYIPVLIFSANAVTSSMAELPIAGQLYFLASFLLFCFTLAPIATSAALRVSLE
jgi:heme exporter protein B